MTLNELYDIIVKRKNDASEGSYTASLFQEGVDKIVQKVGEEAVEVVIASKNDDKDEFVGEVADLYYHLLVLLVAKNISIDEIEQRLSERHERKTKGEKA